jgi:hypothetical protein
LRDEAGVLDVLSCEDTRADLCPRLFPGFVCGTDEDESEVAAPVDHLLNERPVDTST